MKLSKFIQAAGGQDPWAERAALWLQRAGGYMLSGQG